MSQEAKTTKAYKVSLELKEKLESLFSESGMDTQEAFIEHIAALYEMQQLKEGAAGYKKQLDELEYHTRRMNELFLSMIGTEAAERLQLTQQHEEVLAERATTIFSQEQELSDMRKELKQQADELARLAKENADQAKHIEQLEEISRKDGLLVDEYRQKIDTLSGLVNEYKAAADENRELKAEVSKLTGLTEKQAQQIADLEDDVRMLQELKAESLRQQEERHKEILERLTERKDVEKERELLQVRTEYQAKLEKMSSEATERLRAANEESTDKIRELYTQIGNLQEQLRGSKEKSPGGQ